MSVEVFNSISDSDYIVTREIIGKGNFGKNKWNEDVIVPIYRITREHKDTIELRKLQGLP